MATEIQYPIIQIHLYVIRYHLLEAMYHLPRAVITTISNLNRTVKIFLINIQIQDNAIGTPEYHLFHHQFFLTRDLTLILQILPVLLSHVVHLTTALPQQYPTPHHQAAVDLSYQA